MKELLGCLQVIIAMIFSALTTISFIWVIVEIVRYEPFNWWSVGTFVLCFILTAVFLIGGFIFFKT